MSGLGLLEVVIDLTAGVLAGHFFIGAPAAPCPILAPWFWRKGGRPRHHTNPQPIVAPAAPMPTPTAARSLPAEPPLPVVSPHLPLSSSAPRSWPAQLQGTSPSPSQAPPSFPSLHPDADRLRHNFPQHPCPGHKAPAAAAIHSSWRRSKSRSYKSLHPCPATRAASNSLCECNALHSHRQSG